MYYRKKLPHYHPDLNEANFLAFRQDESFDHRVRDEAELDRIVRYIERNPVSAGLVANSSDWLWSSAWLAGESAYPTIPETHRQM